MPAVNSLALVNDTGTSSTDMTTSDATITGTVVNPGGSVSGVLVQIDHNNDGVSDMEILTDANGNFTYDPSQAITPGAQVIQFRTMEIDLQTMTETYGDWNSISFTWAADPNDPPEISSLSLQNDTGASATDSITTDGTIVGTVQNDGSVNGLVVHIDHNNDGVSDMEILTDANGNFSYDAGTVFLTGAHTFQFRVSEIDPFTLQPVYGEWESISFTLEEAISVTAFELSNDTGNPADNSTTDATVQGQLGGDTVPAGVTVSIDLDGDGEADISTTTDSNGAFSIDLAQYISYGNVTINVQIGAGVWTPLSFEYLQS